MTTPLPAEAAEAYRHTTEELCAALEVDPARGLSAAEVAQRLERYGRNELPEEPPTPAWLRFLAQFRDPLTGLLIAATIISFVAWLIEGGESIPFESLTILAIVLLNGVLGFVQESRAEQAVAALRALSSPHARVLRDGRQQEIDAAELVPGDILLVEEGDTLPADARVLESIAMRVAESALTGESTSVSKDSAPLDGDPPPTLTVLLVPHARRRVVGVRRLHATARGYTAAAACLPPVPEAEAPHHGHRQSRQPRHRAPARRSGVSCRDAPLRRDPPWPAKWEPRSPATLSQV